MTRVILVQKGMCILDAANSGDKSLTRIDSGVDHKNNVMSEIQ